MFFHVRHKMSNIIYRRVNMENTTRPQSAAMRHYYKNKENVLAYYHSYYQINKERIKQQRRARYARQQPANNLVEAVGANEDIS
jgi:hypothetical protein